MGARVITNMWRWRITRTTFLSLGFLLLCCLQVTEAAPPRPFSTEDDRSIEADSRYSHGGVSSDDDGNSAEDVHPFFVAPGTNREVHSRSPAVGVVNSQLRHAALAQQNMAKAMSAHSHFRIGRDSLEVPDPHSRETTSSEVVHSGRIHSIAGVPKASFSSQHISFGVDDDDFDDHFDNDNDSHESDDDSPYFGLGRRYQPEGYNYVPAKKLFIPPPASPSPQNTAKQMTQSFSNPFMYAVDKSDEDHDDDHDDHFDDDDDDDVKLYVPLSIVKMRHDNTNEHRLAFNEDTLRGHYNYVDGQGSRRWAYELDDQYQEHTVHNDGTMKGKYGWTAPGGHNVKIQYVADEGGFRVISSHGVYLSDDDDVEEARRHHLLAHKKAGSIIGSADDDDVTLFATGGGVQLPGQKPGFAGTGGNPFQSQPGFGTSGGSGVPLPGLGAGGQMPDGAGLSPGLGGFGGSDDVTFHMNVPGAGVPLPGAGLPGQGSGLGFQGPPGGTSGGTGSFGVPLPHPGAGGATTGGSLFGDDDPTFVFGGGAGGALGGGDPSDPCLLKGKQHPSLAPECQNGQSGTFGGSGGLDFGGGVPLPGADGGAGNFGLQLITDSFGT